MVVKFLELAKSRLGCGYALGSQGEILTPERLELLIRWTGGDRSKYISETKDARKWYGKQCFDCSGLIVWILQQLGLLQISEDYTAHGIYDRLCIPVEKSKLRPGDLCFTKDGKGGIYHVGVFTGNNRVLHARGTNYGVVETTLFLNFNVFGRLKCFCTEDELMVEQVKDFQRRYNLLIDGKIGPETKGKAKEVKELLDYILAYTKSAAEQKYSHRIENDGTRVIKIDPLNLRHVWLRGLESKPAAELAKVYDNFVNAMFFDGVTDTVFRLLIQDGIVLSEIKEYDKWSDKGTFIIYCNGQVEVKTIGRDNFGTLDVPNIHLAIQGFNLDYEVNGSTNLRDSMRREGWGQSDDYIYRAVCMRGAIGYNYKTGKVVIVKKKTDAPGIRTAIREAGCKTKDNDTCGIGLDSGGSDALVLDGKVILGTTRNQVSILTW